MRSVNLKLIKAMTTIILTISCSINVTASTNQPNILWLVIEDMSPLIPAYGDDSIDTPNITRLAEEGVVFNNVFSTSGVCAPSRAALATGLYPNSFGANNMRTSSNTEETGLPKYEAVPPLNTKMLSQLLREAGYYTTNNYKTDYQFKAPKTAWDENGITAHWRNRPGNKPFFSIFNFTTTHESGLFEPYGIRKLEQRHYFSSDAEKISKLPNDHRIKTDNDSTPIHVNKDTKFPVPPYLPDTPIVQKDLWKVYNNLAETDKQIGAILNALEEDGLLDNTIIVFYSDHGGPMPRQKRLIYDSGLKVPLIIRFPKGYKAGTVEERLISFVDFAPTTLSMAGVNIPEYMQGQNFLSQSNERKYIYAAADRLDGITDTIRAVRDHCYKYIRNYRPNDPYYLPVAYREKIPSMRELLELNAAGKLNEAQSQWFRKTKDTHELFNVCNDPNEIANLAYIKNYHHKRKKMENALNSWLEDIGDDPSSTERQLIDKLWDGASFQPKTKAPKIVIENGKAVIASETPGAFISFRLKTNKAASNWQIYSKQQSIQPGVIEAVAHRPGFVESATTTLVVEAN
ncbi:sulfatase [Alteromonas sp. ZYF713]|nr:sulfatase [Alteromonas sp. ZYF713]